MPSESREMLTTVGNLVGTKRRPLIGFLIAPLAPLLALIIIATITSGVFPEVFWGIILILPISYLSSLILGGPAIFLLTLRKRHSFWHYLISGIFASSIPIFVVLIYPILIKNDPAPPDLGWMPAHTQIALLMVLSGALVAATFWIVTRPDKLPEHNN